MPDSLISTHPDRLYVDQVPSDDLGMLHPDAPPILAFYTNPGGLAAINQARCAATGALRGMDGRIVAARYAAKRAFEKRLDHPMPPDVLAYIMRDVSGF